MNRNETRETHFNMTQLGTMLRCYENTRLYIWVNDNLSKFQLAFHLISLKKYDYMKKKYLFKKCETFCYYK